MNSALGIEWKDFLKLSKRDQTILKSLGVPIKGKPKKRLNHNNKPIHEYLMPYTVCIHKNCDLCGTETVQWFRMYCDPLSPGECLRSRPLNPMNYDRLLGQHKEEVHAVCEYCTEELMEWDREELVRKLIILQRAYRGALRRVER